MTNSEHAILAPSSSFRRRLCSGSLTMEAVYPQTEDSEKAREGTAAHFLGEKLIDAYARGGNGVTQVRKLIGTEAPNGVILTDEMFEAADVYASDVSDIMQKITAFNPAIESRVNAPAISEHCWGTPDCTLHDARNRTVYIWDFKFGRRIVDVFECWQLIEYAAGLYQPGKDDRFVLTIAQPRAFHRDGPIRRWVVSAAELEGYIAEAARFEAEALSPDAQCRPDGSACRDCNGRHACETLQRAAYDIMDYAGKPTPIELTPEALSIELRALRKAKALLDARLTGLEAQAEGLIQSGTPVPGFALEAGMGRPAWTISTDEVFAIGDMLGKDLRKSPEPVTPTQAKKLGVDIKGLAARGSTGVKLVESDKTLVARVFGR